MSAILPDGYFYKDHLVWDDPSRGAVVGRGMDISFGDHSAADAPQYLNLQDSIMKALGALHESERLQLHFYTTTRYEEDLDRFERATEGCKVAITDAIRKELIGRYRERMASETLLRTESRLYISYRLQKLAPEKNNRRRGFRYLFEVAQRSFAQRCQFIDLLLKSSGGGARLLDDYEHYLDILRFWSPEQERRFPLSKDEINWDRTIENLCRFSELVPREEAEHGFYLDGHYFGIQVFKTMPRATWMHTMDCFFQLSLPSLRVVVNMCPLNVETELKYEDERYSKLVSNLDPKSPSLQSEVGLKKHFKRADRLMSNQVIPFKAQIICIVHDRTRDGVSDKLEAVRAAIGKARAEHFQPALPTSTLSLYNCATPAFGGWVKYPDWWHKVDDIHLAHMWCTGTTPTGDLDRADWIADGDCNNLVGGACFLGGEPAHMTVAGTSGSGKSAVTQVMALQTAHLFGVLAVIDQGFSWERSVQEIDPSCRPIVIRSNGGQTFNPFDTNGLPLDAQLLGAAVGLCRLLIGRSHDEDKDHYRQSVLSETIGRMYERKYDSWRKRHLDEHFEVSRLAAVLQYYRAGHMEEDVGWLDVYNDFHDACRKDPDLKARIIEDARITEEVVMKNRLRPESEQLIRELAFSRFSPEQHFTLSDLQDELAALGRHGGYHPELCSLLGTLLRSWCRDGHYGPIVDGASNISLGDHDVLLGERPRGIYFDLSRITKQEQDLRNVASFLIANQLRNYLMTLPRAIKKMLVIEEVTSFLEMPDGDVMIIDYYERMRKYNTQVVSILQSYEGLLKSSPAVAAAMLSAPQVMLLRNPNREELDRLDNFLALPSTVKGIITRMPRPADFRDKEEAYCEFVMVRRTDERPRITVGRHYLSDEVLELTESSPERFEERRRAAAQRRREQAASTHNNHVYANHHSNGAEPFTAVRSRTN